MSKFHSIVSRRGFMKGLGLAGGVVTIYDAQVAPYCGGDMGET